MKLNFSEFIDYIEVIRKSFYYKIEGLGFNYNAIRLELNTFTLLEIGLIKAFISDHMDYIVIIEGDTFITFLTRAIAKIDEEHITQTSHTREAIKDIAIVEAQRKLYTEIYEVLEK